MNNPEFEEKIKDFWDKTVVKEYNKLAARGIISDKVDYYMLQTPPRYAPDLMIVGINPGGKVHSGNRWSWPKKDANLYTTDGGYWFNTVRKIFGYPNNEKLKSVLDNCVGSNVYFINTPSQRDIPAELKAASDLIVELINLVNPKHIIGFGDMPYRTLRKRDKKPERFGSILLTHGETQNGIPIARVYNPSKINEIHGRFTEERCRDWQAAIEWFMTL